MKNKSKIILSIQSLQEVFIRPAYIILASIIALLFFIINIVVSKYEFLFYIFGSELFDLGDKLGILWNSLISIETSFTSASITIVIILSILAGINISILIFYFKKIIALQGAAGTSVLGIITAFVGVGCASCGSIILSSIFGFIAVTAFIGFLPFNGLEFGMIGILALLFSTYLISRKIEEPLVCKKD